MKETAINSVYVIIHCIAETEELVESLIFAEHGFLWDIRFTKDSAEKEVEELNNKKFGNTYELNGKIYFHKYAVIEKTIY